MTGALSLYLDALRVAAAFTVFFSHYGNMRISGGLLWHFSDYGHTAVLVFFVLSGFVIASVAETRERSLENYALTRIARLYSVMIPAFVVTAVLDWLGQAIDPTLYGPEWNPPIAHPALSYALSAVFLGQSWTLAVLPGFNVPFWSLNYEACTMPCLPLPHSCEDGYGQPRSLRRRCSPGQKSSSFSPYG